MELDLAGKNVLALASSQGLGAAIAQALVEEGCNVLLTGRDGEKLDTLASRMGWAAPGSVHYVACDLSDPNASQTLFQAAQDKLGQVDILINNTGGPPAGPVTGPDADSWRAQFDAMVLRIIEITNLCLPGMRERGWGRVLTLASSGIVQPIPNLGMSNTLRSALAGWSKTLSNEVAADGVTVNMLLPGRIHTDRVDQLDAGAASRTNSTIDEVRTKSRATIPAGRYGKVEEFAAVATFLVSERASYVTGSQIRCDGGSIKSV